MKFLAVCGSGLGSSFMVEMNIKKVLKELGVTGVEVEHADVGSAVKGAADVFIFAKDIAEGLTIDAPTVVLDSIIDMEELREKITAICKEMNLI
ncbi:MAG: PTS sugar transporter subunit IIB [Erysipelotrichaceae bacterium]|nr:PTS sugar transporter subunit IIB [Bacillota bacterium]NLP22754.1 PTS sugar transporter subunit IIB [Erysipelotrichaceae bacterium]HCY06520.1 PTS lactose transporter subunit IIB [Erysipelotrichaceae bacterium]